MRTPAALSTNPDEETASYGPPLKWAGGKRWQVPHLQPLWEPHRNRRLVEPFCGGLSVALGLKPERALLNDVNAHLINFYRWVKRGLSVESSLVNSRVRYYAHRRRFNELVEDSGAATAEAATLFYYLNKTGYNGLCRFNRSGLFNVPFGRHKKITYRPDFREYRPTFRKWEFKSTDFARLQLEASDFIYADPPYDVEFTQYSQYGFGWEEQVRAATWLAKHRGPVVLANQATPRIVKLYESLGFQLVYLKAPRRISCTGDRAPADEVLALRNLRLSNGCA
jgi:DNA adenine methylase